MSCKNEDGVRWRETDLTVASKWKEEEVVGVEKSFIGENALVGRKKENPHLSLQLTACTSLFSYRCLCECSVYAHVVTCVCTHACVRKQGCAERLCA